MKWEGDINQPVRASLPWPSSGFVRAPNSAAMVTGTQALLGVNSTDFLFPGSSGNCPVPYLDSGGGQHWFQVRFPRDTAGCLVQVAYTGPLPSAGAMTHPSWNRCILDRDVALACLTVTSISATTHTREMPYLGLSERDSRHSQGGAAVWAPGHGLHWSHCTPGSDQPDGGAE